MKITANQDQYIDLKIQAEIRQAEDELVIAIQNALDQKESYGKLDDSQFRNLVRVAATTDSPEVIKNFLRYQVGRGNKWGRGKGSLAENIINHINRHLQAKAETIAKETSPEKKKEIWLELIRRYLGYGARYLKYLKPDK